MSSFISFSQSFFETLLTWIVPSFFKVALIILLAFFIQYLINLATENFLRNLKLIRRIETIRQIISSSSHLIIILISLMMILNELGFDVRPLLASAGLLGVAFSLGAQHLMKDVINGFLILIEDQFTIGDKVKLCDISGTVERLNLRTTTIKDTNGNIHIIPNSEIKQVTVLK